jgi:hypothetical protein
MDDVSVEFASRAYWLCFATVLFGRGMDFFSTWVASPTLKLEANPIARRLGWKLGILVNVALCFGVAAVPVISIILCTTSVLVAAHNFQSARLIRSMGEDAYRDWYLQRLRETPPGVYVGCLFAQTGMFALVGGALAYFSNWNIVALGVGVGIIGYAIAVLVFTLVSVWRSRR